MPGYIQRVLAKYKHLKPKKPQYSPYPVKPRKYGKAAQDPMPEDDTPPVDKEERLLVQQVVGSIIYYAKSVNLTALTGLSTLASEQAKATGQTVKNMGQMLDYLATNPDATL